MSQTTEIKPGLYKHYKGNNYQVLDTVTHSETMEKLVLYKPLYGEGALWVRPFDMFTESVTIGDMTVPRFALVKADE